MTIGAATMRNKLKLSESDLVALYQTVRNVSGMPWTPLLDGEHEARAAGVTRFIQRRYNKLLHAFQSGSARWQNPEYTDRHQGKMVGMNSLSIWGPAAHQFCIASGKNAHRICHRCYYVYGTALVHRETIDKPMKNYIMLRARRLAPIRTMMDIFRFNSFGELSGREDIEYFIECCDANPATTFSLCTKRPDIVNSVIGRGTPKPRNMILVYSWPWRGDRMTPKEEDLPENFDKIFTAWKIFDEKSINCGARNCYKCRMCYTFNDVVLVNEMARDNNSRPMDLKKMLEAEQKRRKEKIKRFIEKGFIVNGVIDRDAIASAAEGGQ